MHRFKVSFEDMDKLIDLVRQSPALYDPTHKDYKDTCTVENVWANITKEMARDDMSVSDWRKKWINRRDTYVKKKRLIRTSRNPLIVERATRWRFFQAMSFMDRFFDAGNETDYIISIMKAANGDDSSDGMSADEDTNESMSVSGRQKVDGGKKRNRSFSPSTTEIKRRLEADLGFNYSKVLSSGLPAATSVGINGADDLLIQGLMNNSEISAQVLDPPSTHQYTHQQHNNTYPSPSISPRAPHVLGSSSGHDPLFQAYAARMKHLPVRTQSFLQLQIAQLFFNAENPDLPQVPIMPLPRQLLIEVSSSSRESATDRRQDNGLEPQQQNQQNSSCQGDQSENGIVTNEGIMIKVENV